jgi:uncharacterized protein YbaP (TraB family)
MRLPAALIVSLSVALLACKSEPKRVASRATTAEAAPDTITRPFLWRAEKDGKTTWLFGTMHLGVDGERQLPPWVAEKIAGASAFVMEADVSDAGVVSRALLRTDGGTLRTDLGPAHWKKLEAAIGAGLAQGFDGMRPFAVLTLLLAKDLPMTPPMDSWLVGRAQVAGKPIHYLETVGDQIAMIDPWMTAADIKAMLDNPELSKQSATTLLAAYLAGDGDTLGAMFEDQTLWRAAGRKPETFPAYLDALLANRNRAWVPQLEQLHAGGGAFVAVGAGHLVGPGNVLDLLAARGFQITRVGGP